jgi:hypothetical protein
VPVAAVFDAAGAILPEAGPGAAAVIVGALTAPSGAGALTAPSGAGAPAPGFDMLIVVPGVGAMLPEETPGGVTFGEVTAPVGAGVA